MARYVKVTWKSQQKMLVPIPSKSSSENSNESAMSNALRELFTAMCGNNLYNIDLDSIRFSIEED